jgi:hypothetical protein
MIAMDMTTRYAMRYVMQAVVVTHRKNGHVFPSYNCHSILLSYLDFRLQLRAAPRATNHIIEVELGLRFIEGFYNKIRILQ